jgi:hypothetical protein
LLLAAGVFAAVAHPKTRAKLGEVWNGIREAVGAITPGLSELTETLAVQWLESHEKATQKRAEVEATLPHPRQRSLLQHARSVCLGSQEPLPLAEIEVRMRNAGYLSRAKNFTAYLRRQLRANTQFIEVTPGHWALRSQEATVS